MERSDDLEPDATQTIPARRPEPLPEATRRFLRPLVGFDPQDVPVFRDEEAEQHTRALNAEALATEDGIEFGSHLELDTPKTRGLLAHELVHIARRSNRTFVPPILQSETAPDLPGRQPAEAAGGEPAREEDSAPPLGFASMSEEESLALQTEANVTRIARRLPTAARETAPQPDIAHRAAPAEDWGGLPAPWEPLPPSLLDQFDATPQTRTSAPPAVVPMPQAATPVQQAPVQRASIDRPQVDGSEGTAVAPDEVESQVEPDLDRLAREVYAVLKRRIAAERRRFG